MDIQHKSFKTAVTDSNDAEGTICAIVSVTGNIDRTKEVVMPGFFTESLKAKLPKGVWSHQWEQPIAKTLIAEEWKAGDPRLPGSLRGLGGYYIKGQFNLDTQRGREAYSDVKFGIVDEFSIGYAVQEKRFNKEKGVTELYKGEWYEWSPVLVGANQSTQLISVKDAAAAVATASAITETTKQNETVLSKGMFEDALDEQNENLYNLCDLLMMTIYRAQMNDDMAEYAGTTFDLVGAVDQILAEFSARVRAAVLEEDTEEDSGTDDDMPSGEIEMSALDDKPLKFKTVGAASAQPFEKHSLAVASIVAEFASRSQALKSEVSDFTVRAKKRGEIRLKEGRTHSQATIERMQAARESIKEATAAMQTVHDDLGALCEQGTAKSADTTASLANSLYARFLESEFNNHLTANN